MKYLFGRLMFVFSLLLLSSGIGVAQITLDSCKVLAKQNDPLILQRMGIAERERLELNNTKRLYLPQINIDGRASYQSDVTRIELPAIIEKFFVIPHTSRDQYYVRAHVSQFIWAGGYMGSKQSGIKADARIESLENEVSLYETQEQVEALYFGLLRMQVQLDVARLSLEKLATTYKKLDAYQLAGLAMQSDVDIVRVNQIEVERSITQLESALSSSRKMLGLITGLSPEQFALPILPEAIQVSAILENHHPALSLFDAQRQRLDSKERLVHASNVPRLSAFATVGYGNPALNMLEDKFRPYYVAGINLEWSFGPLYTRSNDLKLLKNARERVGIEEQSLKRKLSLQEIRLRQEIDLAESRLEGASELIELRSRAVEAEQARFDAGVIDVSALVDALTAERSAMLGMKLDEIMRVEVQYKLRHLLNDQN